MISKVYLSIACVLMSLSMVACATDASSSAAKPEIIVLNAIKDFSAVEASEKVWYIDTDRKSLAVDAEKFKDQFGTVQSKFDGVSGTYTIKLTALTETDGESQYQVTVDGNKLSLASNPESDTDFATHVHQWENVLVSSGSTIQVSFNSATNGKIPEGDTTAYARGRWTKVEFVKQ